MHDRTIATGNAQAFKTYVRTHYRHAHGHCLQHFVLCACTKPQWRHHYTRAVVCGRKVFYKTGYNNMVIGQSHDFCYRALPGNDKLYVRKFDPYQWEYGFSEIAHCIHIRGIVHIAGKEQCGVMAIIMVSCCKRLQVHTIGQ